MGPYINDCGKHVYCWIDGEWIDITDLIPACVHLAEEADDDIPFCDPPSEDCPDTDCMDDFDIVDEDEYEELWEGEEPPFWGIPDIHHIIFNDPATIVFWEDGTKTVVKCMEGEKFERYAGFAMACMKKMFGSTGAAKRIMEESYEAVSPEALEISKSKHEPKEKQPKPKDGSHPVTIIDLTEALTKALQSFAKGKGNNGGK